MFFATIKIYKKLCNRLLKAEIGLPDRKVEYFARIVDTDNDGLMEVLYSTNGLFGPSDVRIYEWENNQLNLRWIAPDINSYSGTKAVADFDGDEKLEIATVASSTIYVYENVSDNTYRLTQTLGLPSGNISVLEEANLDGDLPAFTVGLQYGTSPIQFEWRIFKSIRDNYMEAWYRTSFPQNIWITRPKHTKGDFDNDGLDEILVDDHPTLKMLEYVDGQMQETWSSSQPNPHYLATADLRMDGVDNFVLVNFISGSHLMSFWEEEKLANAYLNKSLSYYATAYNNNHTIERGYFGRLHEVFHSDGEIFYRRSSDNGTSWEITTRLSSGNGSNEVPSIVAGYNGSTDILCVVWQRKIDNYNYEVYTRFSSNMGTTWLSAPAPINVTVSWNQSNGNYGPGPTPVVASYWRGGAEGTPSFLLVYAMENGLHYRTAITYSSWWSGANIVPSSYGPSSNIWFPSSASYNSQDYHVTMLYGVRFGSPHIYSQNFYEDGSWSNRVAIDWLGTYNRYPSLALDYARSTLGVWSGWNSTLSLYTTRFRQGFSDGTWSSWAKEWAVSGVNSFHPVVSYYNKGGSYPYGIDILWYTHPALEIRQKKYFGLGDNWIPADPNTQLLASNGMFANITHERQNTPLPIQAWTDQSTPPIYSILYNSAFLPKEELLADGEIRRAAEITDALSVSNLRIELSEPVVTLTNGEKISIPFRTYDYSAKLKLTTSNVFEYLQTMLTNIPNNASVIAFKVNISASQPDTLSDGSINTNKQTPFTGINFSLSAKDSSSNTFLSNIGAQNLNNNSGLHNFSNEFTINAAALRGKNILFIPGVNLTGSFSLENLHFTLVNVSIEGSGLAKDSTKIAKDNIMPTEYGLEQNYPNPFNPVTQIQYSIVKDGLVTLKVFDVLGREVATLVNEGKPVGTYTENFDASRLSSGIYFYCLTSGSYNQTRKMILIK